MPTRHGRSNVEMVLGALRVQYPVREKEGPQGPSTGRLRHRDDRSRLPVGKKHKWTIFIDGASSSTGSGARVLLENGDGIIVEHSFTLSFPTLNNQVEYEALLTGLRLAEDLGACKIQIFTDSQLIASQVQGGYQTKNNSLIKYLNLVKERMKRFDRSEIKHVLRK